MIPCPSCHQPVEILDKHMGTLFTCPHCNAVYFVDWNGQPELAQHETEQEIAPTPGYEETPSFDGGGFEPPIQNYEPPLNEVAPEEAQGFPEAPPEAPAETQEETPAEAPYDFGQTLDAAPEMPFTGTPDTSDFSDVTDFANANTSAGPLSYTVRIEGVDSSRLLAQLKEAMTDSHFGWDIESVLTNMGGGHIVLRGLTPAKASVLINRIKYLPFKISWRQDVLSGS